MIDIATKLCNIADASRREDGTDIPLGEQCREAATEIRLLWKLLDDALEALDGISTEPTNLNDGYDHYRAARVVAKTAATYIRSQIEHAYPVATHTH